MKIEGTISSYKATWEAMKRWGSVQLVFKTESMPMAELMELTGKIKNSLGTTKKGTITVTEGRRFIMFEVEG